MASGTAATAKAIRPARKKPRQFGSYVLHEELGKGGMAVVYRAESRRTGDTVALKILEPNAYDVDFDLVRSFVEEARLATRFASPNIARTHSLGKVGGRYFIEMEYVAGKTLVQVAKQSEIAGAIPLPVVLEILIQICDALAHVHELRDDTGKALALVHRDVSLSNIIVATDGTVKLIDFGIVKGHSSKAPTEAGTIKGKVAYIAPEYLLGKLDQRADLFAVGVIAHELVTGKRLFLGKNDIDTITRVREMRVPPPSRVRPDASPALDAIVLRALARDPDQRWQSARELRAALVALRGGTGTEAAPVLVRDWIEQAFDRARPRRAQKPSTGLLRVIDSLEQVTVTVELETQLVEVMDEAVVEATHVVEPLPRPAPAPAAAAPRAPTEIPDLRPRRTLAPALLGAIVGMVIALAGTLAL
jgi:serine/threonine protein kinase